MRKFGLIATSAIVYVGMVASGSAAVIYGGKFSGTDCSGKGGFDLCYADTNGTYQEPNESRDGSPSIFKRDAGGGQDIGSFDSITGGEFSVSHNAQTNVLSWTYTPDLDDPEIHYFTVKQGDAYALFYDLDTPITSWSGDLDLYFTQPGYSHITWFDTGSTTTTEVSEPATLALLGAGLAALGVWRRRKPA
ncbi:PEP-CTERM sorting domain-containing protein [Desertibaculum subflavum]|uniref:PEP-CTERM sorting domain-containing protein n=1 Tax=Desertibaculum subflavum TaxID=2268458 RepID=UPI000E66D7D3